jgi:hypothetical protein
MRIRRKKTILEHAADYIEAAVEKAGPILAEAKEKAGPTLVDARDKAAPLIAQSAALAAEKASRAADLASDKATELSAELSSEPKKKHRLRKLLLLTGLAALIGFAAKKLRSGDGQNWQSSYTPTPPPQTRDADRTDTPIADATVAAATEAADEGGAGPDEALSDAVEESHDVTTPDDPADIVALEPEEEAAKKS